MKKNTSNNPKLNDLKKFEIKKVEAKMVKGGTIGTSDWDVQ